MTNNMTTETKPLCELTHEELYNQFNDLINAAGYTEGVDRVISSLRMWGASVDDFRHYLESQKPKIIKNMKTTVTVTATSISTGETRRIKLGTPTVADIGEKLRTGITLENIWIGRKYIVAETYSIWANNSGECEGGSYVIYDDPRDIGQLEDHLSGDEFEKCLRLLGVVAETV